jgi:hypothetical protein
MSRLLELTAVWRSYDVSQLRSYKSLPPVNFIRVHQPNNTLTCNSDYWRDFGLEVGFFDHLQVVTTNNYNTIANFHTLQITAAHAKSFQCAFTSRFPVTDLNNGDSSTVPTKSSLHRLPYKWLLTTQNWELTSSPSYIMTDGQSASLSWNKAPAWGLTTRFSLLSDSCGFVYVGRTHWREDGSAVYSCC